MQGHSHRCAMQLPGGLHAAARWKDMQRSVQSRSRTCYSPPHPARMQGWWGLHGWAGRVTTCSCRAQDSQLPRAFLLEKPEEVGQRQHLPAGLKGTLVPPYSNRFKQGSAIQQ